MSRSITESVLGLRLTGEPEEARLHFAPWLPGDWKEFKVHYRFRETMYHIIVRPAFAANAAMIVSMDGVTQPEPTIPLLDDRREHQVEVRLVSRPVPAEIFEAKIPAPAPGDATT